MQRLSDDDFSPKAAGVPFANGTKTRVNKSAEKSAFQFIIAPRNRWGKEKELAVFSRLLDTAWRAFRFWLLAISFWRFRGQRPTANSQQFLLRMQQAAKVQRFVATEVALSPPPRVHPPLKPLGVDFVRLEGGSESVGARVVGFGTEVQVVVLGGVEHRIEAGYGGHADGAWR